ncbi:hypothetical protein IWQ47_001618 [Aquimarina sp. EL_43]|nr:hypothetical protein [Aquimarina sp. EL_35]MBG6149079.1 hypothetical protein [Aquimarina sp. EL_32]MBG6168547.1 hypothetical protein [Aquimarina sp. EL_43]
MPYVYYSVSFCYTKNNDFSLIFQINAQIYVFEYEFDPGYNQNLIKYLILF